MKTIALFGASGRTGQHFLNLALSKGYKVKALVRNIESISQKKLNLELIKGDVLIFDDVLETVKNCDIVVSLFGHVKDSPNWLQTDGTKNIIQAMNELNLDRIISLSGGALPYPEKDKPKFADIIIKTIMKIVVPKILNDAEKHYDALKNSKLKWTIVCAPRLTNDKKTGNYRIGWVGVNASTKIGRADFAAFLITQIEDETYINQMPFISN